MKKILYYVLLVALILAAMLTTATILSFFLEGILANIIVALSGFLAFHYRGILKRFMKIE